MNLLKSSIVKKIIMALTGAGLVLFIIGHLLGNLQIFISQDKFNEYAALLKSLGGLLWVARIGLIAILVAHVGAAISLAKQNLDAKPVGYKVNSTFKASSASRHMLHTGMIIFFFILIHLAHFTFGYMQPQYYNLPPDSLGRHDVYTMVIYGFQSAPYVIGYVIAMIGLGFHLSHATSSMFQTIGISGPKITPLIKKAATAFAVAIVIGYISIPLAVFGGFIGA